MNRKLRTPSMMVSVLALAGATFACSAAGSKAGENDLSCADKSAPGCGDNVTSHAAPAPSKPSAPDAATAPPPADAGIDAPRAPPDASKPPPTTKNCMDLSKCCGTLSDFGDKLACIGVSLAANETACNAALVVCNAGGIGITTLFQSDNPNCGKLATCCDTLDADGYVAAAADCQDWVQMEDETACQDQLQSYQDFGECL